MTSHNWVNRWDSDKDRFPEDQLDGDGDAWGIRWRGIEKQRHTSYLDLIRPALSASSPQCVLDIGCALCDFTEKAWRKNTRNRFFCTDVSRNAVEWTTKKFPQFTVRQAALPDIGFEEKFDVVFCLQVICYLNREGRGKAIENIAASMTPDGTLLFAGALDGGNVHHTEQEVRELLQEDFEIQEVIYNHLALYRRFLQYPLDRMTSALSQVLKVIRLSQKEADQWLAAKKSGAATNTIAKTLRALNPFSYWILWPVWRLGRAILESEAIATAFNAVSNLIAGRDKYLEIVVLATRSGVK